MSNIILPRTIEYAEQLSMMDEDAQYEVADFVDRETGGVLPDVSAFSGIRSQQAPPKVPKVFLSNNCTFNCAYCTCRASREEKTRYTFEPHRLAEICVAEAIRNGHGVFLTSAVHKNADYTEELIIETARIAREELGYKGYLHAKIMPGADRDLIKKAAMYASRLSVNIEVARSSGYAMIAKQKNRSNILTPMNDISEIVAENRAGKSEGERTVATSQTTQLMAGSTGEDDRTIMTLSAALYKKYRLSRVYYTPFTYRAKTPGYDIDITETPYWRMSRLYQADRLVQLYGFTPDDVTPESEPNLACDVDPKAAWALRHLDMYPVDVGSADYETLLRVPGIGTTYARKIIAARRLGRVTHETLKHIGIPLKRCVYFIECSGKYLGAGYLERPQELRAALASGGEKPARQFELGCEQ